MTFAVKSVAAPGWLQSFFGGRNGMRSERDRSARKKARRKSSAAAQKRRRASSAGSSSGGDNNCAGVGCAGSTPRALESARAPGRTYAIPSRRLLLNILVELTILVATFTSMFISNLAITAWYPFDLLKATALRNALSIVAAERAVGIFLEKRMQNWALDRLSVTSWWWWNTYYAGVHTVVTVGLMVFFLVRMLWWDAGRARKWEVIGTAKERWAHKLRREPHHQYFYLRTVFVISTALSTWGYVALPTMPPRLLNYCGVQSGPEPDLQGACDSNFDYVDTIRENGSLFWTWKDVKKSANPYAAFPSVHTLWSAFVAFSWIWVYGNYVQRADTAERASLWKVARHQLIRFSVVLYPLITVYCIIITGNHWIIDALGGLAILAVSVAATNLCFAGRRSYKQIRISKPRSGVPIAAAANANVLGSAPLSASASDETLANDSRDELLVEIASSSSDTETEMPQRREGAAQRQLTQKQQFFV